MRTRVRERASWTVFTHCRMRQQFEAPYIWEALNKNNFKMKYKDIRELFMLKNHSGKYE